MQRSILIDAPFAAGPIGAGLARRELALFERELPAAAYAKIRLLVSQLVANARWHPSAASAASLALRIERHESFVRVRVTDAVRPREVLREQLDANRWDTFLLEEMSDRWGVLSDTGSDLWFEVDTEG